jgi:hypothetical protein
VFWSLRSRAEVSEEAKNILIERALVHRLDIETQLRTGQTSRNAIVESAIAQLATAAEVAARDDVLYLTEEVGAGDAVMMSVSADNMRAGMNLKCY